MAKYEHDAMDSRLVKRCLADRFDGMQPFKTASAQQLLGGPPNGVAHGRVDPCRHALWPGRTRRLEQRTAAHGMGAKTLCQQPLSLRQMANQLALCKQAMDMVDAHRGGKQPGQSHRTRCDIRLGWQLGEIISITRLATHQSQQQRRQGNANSVCEQSLMPRITRRHHLAL